MITEGRHTTATLPIVRPMTAAPCHWCGFTRSDHYGNAGWADTLLRCPDRSAVSPSLGGRPFLEPTYTASN